MSQIEQRILEQIRKGNEMAFVEVYNKYWKQLYNSGYRRLRKQEIVEGLVQEVFVEMWQKRTSLEVHTSLGAYLFTAMKYKVINHIKSQVVKEKYVDFVKSRNNTFGSEVEEKLYYRELDEAYQKEVACLPGQAKIVYELKNSEGMTYAEIAKVMEISISTVEKHMIKALKILRENLRRYSFSIFGLSILQLCEELSNVY
ncbi:DNA-directed RNA polymerase sigma-70 factor [Echinicola pacifica]|uniref:DNA-directed RNA polymerase sigma-70 factor n=1 Tax=Echinicola pacifica TaxID=346377 RepID=A0A918PMB8_9BACT|nr:RNA polymerase sigma-70 factor [Echinicola pacifica]GGZ14561.1 DNA-directed RNA polymerase sigma-70 factor [Echinicola pacifica]